MIVYLTGNPVSIKKSIYSRDVLAYVSESEKLALIERADILHSIAPVGFSRKASSLKVKKYIVQLRTATNDQKVILVWVYLNDGSKYNIAWSLSGAQDALYRTWLRIPWSDLRFRTKGAYKPS